MIVKAEERTKRGDQEKLFFNSHCTILPVLPIIAQLAVTILYFGFFSVRNGNRREDRRNRT